jgi:hypothetical protein
MHENSIKHGFKAITALELYEKINKNKVNEVFLTVSDPIIVFLNNGSKYFPEYFKINFADYLNFQQHYCKNRKNHLAKK